MQGPNPTGSRGVSVLPTGARKDEFLLVLADAFARIRGVMGDGAAFALMRFSATEAGERLAGRGRPEDVRAGSRRIASLLGLSAAASEDGRGHVSVRLEAAGPPRAVDPCLRGLAVGLLEGWLHATREHAYHGAARDAQDPGAFIVDLTEEDIEPRVEASEPVQPYDIRSET